MLNIRQHIPAAGSGSALPTELKELVSPEDPFLSKSPPLGKNCELEVSTGNEEPLLQPSPNPLVLDPLSVSFEPFKRRRYSVIDN